MLDRWLGKNHPEMESPITFCSDRKKVSLLPSEIVYVESCDTEVLIHVSDGRKLRNKTGIAQWESVLGEQFIRVHRAFLVNSEYVSSYKLVLPLTLFAVNNSVWRPTAPGWTVTLKTSACLTAVT